MSKSTPGQKGRPRPDPAVTLLLRRPPGHHTGQDGTPCDKAAPQLLSATTLWTDDGSSIRPPKKHFFQQTLCVPLETNAGGIVVFTQHWRVARKLGGCPLGQREIIINAQASAVGIVVVLAREAVWDYDTAALVEADQGLADKPAASASPHRVSCLIMLAGKNLRGGKAISTRRESTMVQHSAAPYSHSRQFQKPIPLERNNEPGQDLVHTSHGVCAMEQLFEHRGALWRRFRSAQPGVH